jgi:endoribonuclease Dicer
LSKSFLTIDQINLLIFDEAHHTKKNHAYARIVKDFYLNAGDSERKPRILGMTASPVDSNIDFRVAAHQLESLLCSEIVTVPDGTLSPELKQTFSESTVRYCALKGRFSTQLHRRIEDMVKNTSGLKKALAFAPIAASELGPWCADRFWKLCLRDHEIAKLAARAQDKAYYYHPIGSPMEDAEAAIRQAHQIVDMHQVPPLRKELGPLSSKVMVLAELLERYFSTPNDHKCLVFVEQRYTAMMLHELFSASEMKIPYLRSGYLVYSFLTTLGYAY